MVTRLEDARIEVRIDTDRAERRVRELQGKQEELRRGRRRERQEERDRQRGRGRRGGVVGGAVAGRVAAGRPSAVGAAVTVAGVAAGTAAILQSLRQGGLLRDLIEVAVREALPQLAEPVIRAVLPDFLEDEAVEEVRNAFESFRIDLGKLEKLLVLSDKLITGLRGFETARDFVAEQFLFGRRVDPETITGIFGVAERRAQLELEEGRLLRSQKRRAALTNTVKLLGGGKQSR